MTDTRMSRVAFILFATCLAMLAFAGNWSAQAAFMVLAVALTATLGFGLLRSPAANGFSRLLTYALAGAVGFAAWNLFAQPNMRWAHRAFIYTAYGAAIAIILLATVLEREDRSQQDSWYIAGEFTWRQQSRSCWSKHVLWTE